MGYGEHRRIFNAYAGERRDVEEPPVVDLRQPGAPEGETVMLRVEQIRRRSAIDSERLIRERKTMLMVSQLEPAVAAHNLQLTAPQHGLELVAEHRQEHAALDRRRLPVDVEEMREFTVATAPEHVPPETVARVGNAHVVRDDVEKLAHTEQS